MTARRSTEHSPSPEASLASRRPPSGLEVSPTYRCQSVVRVPGLDKSGAPLGGHDGAAEWRANPMRVPTYAPFRTPNAERRTPNAKVKHCVGSQGWQYNIPPAQP